MRVEQKFRSAFGFTLILIIAILALCIALGTVRMESSYGLNVVLGCLTTLSGSFATWAFGGDRVHTAPVPEPDKPVEQSKT